MDDNIQPPDQNNPPPAGGIPDDDEFLNSLFASSRQGMPQQPSSSERGGKARDRYQKRREKNPAPDIKAEIKAEKQSKTQKAAQPVETTPPQGTRRVRAVPTPQTQPVQRLRTSQVSIPGGYKLPDLNLKRFGIYAYIGAAVLIVIGVIIFLGLFKNDPAPTYPNAIWIGSEWTFESPEPAQIIEFAEKLRANRIGTVYAWVSFLKGDNEWSGVAASTHTFEEVEPNVISFVSQFRAAYPQANLYGWVSFPIDIDGTYRLSNPDVVTKIAEFSGRVIKDLGFDGVMLNAEPVWNANSADYIALLQAIRREIGDAPLAVAVFPDWSPAEANIPKPPQIAPGTEYSVEFKQSIALMVDEIMVMAYNSDLSTPPDYVEWVAYQTQAYAKAVAEVEGGASVRVGIPTYADTAAHDTTVENIPSAISGVIEGLEQAGDAARVIDGVAIYASWETDEDEWRLFDQFWVQR